MADRFVSGGTAEEPPERDADWLAAQKELDSNAQRRKQAESNQGSGLQEGGKTLYEVLQANKAAKQDAFEESAKLKNQFRSLDEDEIEFLDEVLESTRKKESEVKKDTTEQLEAFRRQREEAEKAAAAGDGNDGEAGMGEMVEWNAPKKRKRVDRGALRGPVKGMKVRRRSEGAGQEASKVVKGDKSSPPRGELGAGEVEIQTGREVAVQAPKPPAEDTPKATSSTASAAVGLGLGDYDSDDE